MCLVAQTRILFTWWRLARVFGGGTLALGAVGCDKESPYQTVEQRPIETNASQANGVFVLHKPCRLQVDSPADGVVDGVFQISYEDELPQRVELEFGVGEALNGCVSLSYADGHLVSKTVHEGDCSTAPKHDEASQVQRVDDSNLVALTFPDEKLTYHYVTAPGDFSFLLTRTGYNLGPQPIADVEVEGGRFESLELPKAAGAHTLQATYRAGLLIRVSQRGPQGDEVGYASYHYRDERLIKVDRKLATMDEGQREVVELIYRCDDAKK